MPSSDLFPNETKHDTKKKLKRKLMPTIKKSLLKRYVLQVKHIFDTKKNPYNSI